MAFSDNLMAMEQWGFRPMFNDSWLTDMLVKETETLTKVIQKSEVTPPVLEMGFQALSASGPTVSGGSDQSFASSKQLSSSYGGELSKTKSKKIVKRKPRASKRASTTYITADVDSFRQMVQQVTGVRVVVGGGGDVEQQLPVSSILKPEPRRPAADRVQPFSCLPTLDTSAFLLDPTSSFMQQQQRQQPPPPLPPPSAVVVDGGFGFDSFNVFPTLESGM